MLLRMRVLNLEGDKKNRGSFRHRRKENGRPRKKTKHTHIIQHSHKNKRCCPPFPKAHKLTTTVVTNILLKEFLLQRQLLQYTINICTTSSKKATSLSKTVVTPDRSRKKKGNHHPPDPPLQKNAWYISTIFRGIQ